MTTATTEKVKIGDTVATRTGSGEPVGEIKRIKGGNAYVLADGETTKFKLSSLVKVTKLRAAKADAKKETGDTAAMPAHSKRGDTAMTSKIQIIIQGQTATADNKTNPNWRSIARSFDTVDDAKKYLAGFDLLDIKDREAKLKEPALADVRTNYDIKLIQAGTEPGAPLPVIIQLAPESQRQLVIPPKREAAPTAEGEAAPTGGRGAAIKREPKASKASDPNLVPLKVIARDIGIEAREARIKLRSLRKANKLPHEPTGRWEWPKDQIEAIKAALQGKDEKKVKPPKATKAAEKIEAKAADEAKATATKSKPSKATAKGKASLAKAKRGARKGAKQHAKR